LNRAKTIHNEKNNAEIDRNTGIETEIDRLLATKEELLPSSGFLASVMERVQQEAALPPPIPFPWKLAVPGILLAAAAFAWGTFELVHLGSPALGWSALSWPALDWSALDLSALNSLTLPLPHLSAALTAPLEEAGWVALSLGASLLSWLLARSLSDRGGLL
jgi:hypothetical protein